MNDTTEFPPTNDDITSPDNHHSGFIAVVGRPNVGKSTLMNCFLGQKIAIVSPKPQTTRERMVGILNLPDDLPTDMPLEDCPPAQLIFVDTPGIHKPHHKLGEFLVETAIEAIPNNDLLLWIVDANFLPSRADKLVAEAIQQAQARHQLDGPVVLILNKVDALAETTSDPEKFAAWLESTEEVYRKLYPVDMSITISAKQGDNVPNLLQLIVAQLPLGPRYYPTDQVTDRQLRFMAAELIREATLHLLDDEIPHSIAIGIDEFKERNKKTTYISANIIVERDSQKKIVIGKKGQTLKAIGQRARKEIETLMGTNVYLELWVKVKPKWRTRENELRELGYVLT